MSDFKVFEYNILIKEHHLDTFGHVNNATYLALLEEARWELLNAHGFGLKTICEQAMGPVILECHIKFLKELTLRESIIIESQVLSYKKKIVLMRQDILNAQGALCSQSKMTFGFFDLKARKLISPSDQWLSAIGAN
ncbi:MAG: acyl-CoA thioesterase [Gammaproteobacteria bacterium]|nr:acyl-CoA thioesterase [Gammaproteobacteria bacterium]